MANPFKYAEGQRIKITEKQRKEIKKIYEEVLNELKKDIGNLSVKDDISSSLKRKYLNNIKKDLEGYIKDADAKTEKLVRRNMDKMVNAVLENNQMFVNKIGFYGYVSNKTVKKDIVNRVASGNLYKGKWSLSSAIWGDNVKKLQEINKIVAKGILKNKGIYEIAKDLERYVNPRARKKWDWSNMFPGSRRKIDYNAQRLARTMVSHAYEESFVAVTKNNPFIDAYQWITSGSDKVCELCIDRETVDHYGLGPGIYPKDSLPLDHPNGMCTFDVVMSMSDAEIADAIADWYLGEGDESMNRKIDRYVKDLKKF